MKKFITFEEKILSNMSLNNYINYISSKGVDGLEIAMHEKLLKHNQYMQLAKLSHAASIEINFHVPDFVIEGQYEIAGIKSNSFVKENFIKYYDNILRLMDYAKIDSESIITFHGAKAYDKDYKKAYDNTMFFSDFSLNLFELRNMPFKLSVESLNSNTMTFGDNRIDLVKVCFQFESDKFGICWDIVHDRNNYTDNFTMPDDLFYKYINNIHLHGFRKILTSIEDHIPLYKSQINLDEYVEYLKDHNYTRAMTHELLAFRCSNYKLDLDKDLDLLSEYF